MRRLPIALGALAFASAAHAQLIVPTPGLSSPPAIGNITPNAITGTTINATGQYNLNSAAVLQQSTVVNASVALGNGAGNSLNYSSSIFDTYLGTGAGYYATTSAESTGVGNSSLYEETTGGTPFGHNTAMGQHSCGGFQTDFYRVCVGADSGRNGIGATSSTFIGALSGRNYASVDSVALGANALWGAESTITLALTGASPVAGDVIQVVISGTATLPYTNPGATINYTVTAADASGGLATLAGHVAAAINISATPVNIVGDTDLLGLMPGVVYIDAAGTPTTGQNVNVAVTITTGTGETATVTKQSSNGVMIAIGKNAVEGFQLTTATSDIAIGANDGASLTTGSRNFYGGNFIAQYATTGSDNDCVGESACGALTTGNQTAALGESACGAATTAAGCTALGYRAAWKYVNSGASPTAIGLNALQSATGGFNTAVGESGGVNVTTGAQNTLIGSRVSGSTTGSSNTAVGTFAFQSATSANDNSLFGYQTGNKITTGSGNTCIGKNACQTVLTTGAQNLYIATDKAAIDASSAGATNEVNIAGVYINSQNAPTVTSGAGVSPIVTGLSHAFTVQVGASGTPTASIVLGFATSPGTHNWICRAEDVTAATRSIQGAGLSPTSCTITFPSAPALNDVITVVSDAY